MSGAEERSVAEAVADRTDLEAFVDAFAEGWRAPGGAEGMVAHFTPMLDPQVRLVQPQIPELRGIEEFRTGFAEPLFRLMPDAHGEVLGWAAAAEDVVYIEVVIRGTVGGRPAALRSCDRITLREGRIAERIAYVDPLELLRAVALSPRAWPTFIRMQIEQRRR